MVAAAFTLALTFAFPAVLDEGTPPTLEEVFRDLSDDTDVALAALLLSREVDASVDVAESLAVFDRQMARVEVVFDDCDSRDERVAVVIAAAGAGAGRGGSQVAFDRERMLFSDVLHDDVGNCDSTTLMHLAVCQRLGAGGRAIYVPGHVFFEYHDPEGPLDFEPTEFDRVYLHERHPMRGEQNGTGGPREALARHLGAISLRLTRQGDSGRAEQLLRLGLAALPGNANLMAGLGSVPGVDAGERRELLDRAGRQEPDNAMIWGAVGRFALEQGRCADAVEAFQRAVSLDPLELVSWFGLVVSLEETGDDAGVISACCAALAVEREHLGANRHLLLSLTGGYDLLRRGIVTAHKDARVRAAWRATPRGRRGVVEPDAEAMDEAVRYGTTREALVARVASLELAALASSAQGDLAGERRDVVWRATRYGVADDPDFVTTLARLDVLLEAR